jgi:hypothetical protein
MAMPDGLVKRGFRLVTATLPARPAPEVLAVASAAPQPDPALAAALVPLANLQGTAELLLDTPLGPLQQSYVRHITGWAEEIRTGLGKLLGRSEPASESVDLVALAETIAQLMSGPAHAKGLRFVMQIEPHVPDARASLPVLRRLLVALAAEAIKRTAAGNVTLRVLRVAGGVRIVVLDQADTAEEPSAAAQLLAEELGGELSFVHAEDGGAASLTLPCVADLPVAALEPPTSGVEALLQHLNRELGAKR